MYICSFLEVLHRLFRIKAYIKHPSADLDKQMQLATETDENFYLHQQHQVIALHSIMYLFQYNYSSVSEALCSEIQGYRNRYNLVRIPSFDEF